MAAPLKVGDRVRYSSDFCRTIGAVSGFTPQARGMITNLWGQKSDFAEILWDFSGPDGMRRGGAHLSALERCR
jgi:hypothetical protein